MKRSTLRLNGMIAISAALHFLVDGLCLCSLYLLSPAFENLNLIGVFMTYNILAFLTQPLTGHCADQVKAKHWMLLLSIVLLIAGVVSASVTACTARHSSIMGMLPTAILLGMGNSFFHTWGGKQVAMNSQNDMRALGVFVSTGAFGLSIGAVFHSWPLLYGILIAICLLAMAYLSMDFKTEQSKNGKDDTISATKRQETRFGIVLAWTAIIVLMLLVLMRSWIGESFSSTIKKSDMLIIVIGVIAMAGKMSGGWICRWLGIVRAMVVVLTAVLVCLICREQHFVIGLIGLYAINCTMPVTLFLANEVLKGKEGLAFGLLAAALIPGYLIAVIQ